MPFQSGPPNGIYIFLDILSPSPFTMWGNRICIPACKPQHSYRQQNLLVMCMVQGVKRWLQGCIQHSCSFGHPAHFLSHSPVSIP